MGTLGPSFLYLLMHGAMSMGQRVGPVLPIRIEGQMRRVCDETGYVVSLNIHRHTQTHKVHVANRGGEGCVMWARSTFLMHIITF